MVSIIQKEFTFMTAVHFNNRYMVNLYETNLIMSIETVNPIDQNVAMERLSYFFSNILEDCIFINQDDKDAIDKYTKAGMRVCTIPEDPYDQIIGLVLLNKCNAIMENKIVVKNMIFGSKLSNLIKFELSQELAESEFEGTNWWNLPTLCIQNKKNKKEKIVNLFDHKSNDWEELELTWEKK